MRLQTKLLVALLGGLMAVYVGSSFVQHHLSLSALARFCRECQSGEEARQWQWVQQVHRAIRLPLVDAMAEGEMEKFNQILLAQRGVAGLQEFSLFDGAGRITHSSEPTRLKRDLPPELKSALLSSPQTVMRRTDVSFEIYEPAPADQSCLACHVNWKPGQIGGVMGMRFSAQALRSAEQGWARFEADFRQANLLSTAATTLALILVVCAVTMLAVHAFVTVPLQGVVSSLSDQARQVTDAAASVSAASQTLAGGSSQQAASLEETSASLEEMASMTKHTAANALQADQLARQTRAAAEGGARDMQALAQAMNDLQTSNDDIAKIIKTIDQLAFQTNILALNAAVEAARAGEAGLGFAVVADEVRSLAQRSAHAARETAERIEASISKSGRGVRLSGKVAPALADIVAKARQMETLATEVSTTSREQAQGITQVNTAVGQMDKVTQSNAASAEECAAAAEGLYANAAAMTDSVAQLLQLVVVAERSQSAAGKTAPGPAQPQSADACGLRPPDHARREAARPYRAIAP